MKNLSLFMALTLLLFGCSKPNPEAEKANAESTVKGFYKAAEKFDYATMRTLCAQDFHAIENGHTYKNLDEFLEMAKSLEGSTGQVNMDFVQTEVSRDVAFLIIKFNAVWIKGPSQFNFKTIENYILKKINDKWLISFWQSTYLPDENDKKFTTIHFMKVPETLPIADLNEILKKANENIATLGYPECGYTLLKVVADKGVQYNWIMMGNWKNLDVYKIIHESKEMTEFSNQFSKTVQPYLKDQIYLKASL
jgi:hypothetical protein